MSDKRAPDNLGDIIGAIIGLPITLFILVIWSPFLLLAAVFNVFSTEAAQINAGVATKKPETLSKEGFLLVAAGLFASFVFLLNLKSGGGSGGTTRGGGGYSSPAYSAPGGGPVWVNAYYRQDGAYVPGHYRSALDGDASNNWSNSPNVNPYTGKPGTHQPKNGR